MTPPPSNLRTRTAYAYCVRELRTRTGKKTPEEEEKKQGARVLGSYCNEVVKIKQRINVEIKSKYNYGIE